MKFRIAHCFKQGSIVKYKGAFLIVDYDDYVIKLAFKTIDTLNIKNTTVTAIPSYLMCFRGITLYDGEKSYNLYFGDSVANQVYSHFGL